MKPSARGARAGARDNAHVAWIAAALVILVVAAWLRLARLDLVEFKNDDGIVLRLAEDWVRLGQVPLVGMPSSVGVPLPPWFIYIVAPAVTLSRDPRVASGLVGLINVAGVVGVMVLGRRFFSPLAALVSGLLLATYPWAVFYSRKLWPNDVLAPLAVLYFMALDRAVVGRHTAWAAATLPILAIGAQVHFAFALLAPFILAPLAILVSQRHWRALLAGVGLALLSAVPYLVHLIQTDWIDLRILRELAGSPPEIDASGPALVMSWATSWDTWYLEFVHLDRLLPGRVSAVAADLQTALVGLGVLVALGGAVRLARPRRPLELRLTGLALWLVLPALLTVRHTLALGEQYFPVAPPAAALLVGGGVYWLSSHPARPAVLARGALTLVLASVALVAAIHTFMVVRLLDFVAVSYNDTYGLPLAASERVVDDLVTFAGASHTRAAAIEYKGPESGAMGYLVRPFFPVLELMGEGQVGLGPAHAQVTDRASATLAGLRRARDPRVRYADGVQVTDAATSARWTPGQRVRLALIWTRSGEPAAVAWDVGLYDAQGATLGTQRGPIHLAPSTGETQLSLFSIPTETGTPPGQVHFGVRRVDMQADEWRSDPIDVEP